MNRFKLYLNDTNIEHQKECIKLLFRRFFSRAHMNLMENQVNLQNIRFYSEN